MKYVFIGVFMLFSIIRVTAQACNHVLKGIVRDHHTEEPIPFARIVLEESNSEVQTDSNGFFQFNNLCEGQLTLRCIAHFGCDPIVETVSIPLAEPVVINVETHIIDLDESLVVAYRFRMQSQAGMQLQTNDLSKIKGVTLADQLMRIPGMSTMNTGSGIVKPVINGLHSNRIVVVNNGIRQEGQQWGSEHAPEIDPNLAASLEVIQGASGLQYGPDAIGGVILVKPEPLPYGKETYGWMKLNGQSNGWGGSTAVMLTGAVPKSKRWAYRIHGSGRILGTQHTPDYLIRNTAINEYSFSGALGYKGTRLEADVFYSQFTTNLGIFTGSHIGNLTDLYAAFNAEQPKDSGYFTYTIEKPKQFVQHHLSKLSLSYKWNEKVQTNLLIGYQYNLRQEYDLHKAYNDSIAALNLPAFELNLWTNTAETKTIITHSDHWKSVVGAAFFQQDNAYAGRFFIPNFKKWQTGIYFSETYENEKWQVEIGSRYDFTRIQAFYYEEDSLVKPIKDFGNWSASAGVVRVLGHHFVARLNAGTAWRPPSINELYSNGLHHGAAAIEIGDKNIRKEIVYNVQAGAQYKNRFAKLDIALFWNRFDGFINLQPELPAQLTIVGAFPVFRFRQSDVNMFGLNGQLEVPFKQWLSWTVSGNLLIADDLTADKPVFGMPGNRISNRIHAENQLGKTSWNWFAEVEGLAVFQQKRVQPEDDYAAPPPGYFLMHASFGISKKMNNRQSAQIVLDVSNLLNTTYRDYMNRFRYFTDDVGRNWSLKLLWPISFKKLNKTI